MKIDLFQSCGHCWVFQISWHIECSTFIASSSRIWNSTTGIPSPLLVLFVVMLPKGHLTSHSKMSGSKWVITPSWLLSFILLIFSWNLLLVSLIFLKRSLVFPILLFSSISLHWLLGKTFLSLLAILWNSAFKWVSFLFSFEGKEENKQTWLSHATEVPNEEN